MSYDFQRELKNPQYAELIGKLQFSILSPEAIVAGSVCRIDSAETFDGNIPKPGGLFSPEMGTIDRERICPTCHGNIHMCPGHPGHIELAMPIWNVCYFTYILKILQCVCYHCSNLLINKSDPAIVSALRRKQGLSRFNAVYELAKKMRECKVNEDSCCHSVLPTRYIRKKNNVTNRFHIAAEFRDIPDGILEDDADRQMLILPEKGLEVLSRLSDDDVELMGFHPRYSHPKWLILTMLPIAPPAVRPSIRQDNNQRREDDITFAYVNIVKNNIIHKQKIREGAQSRECEQYRGLIQYYVATLFDNQISGEAAQTQRGNRVLKTFMQRLKNKEGRIRLNLMGKRVDYSGRTVISADPSIDIDEFGIPESFAMTLTYPEIVNRYNMAKLYQLVRNGPNRYPGAKSVVKRQLSLDGTMQEVTKSLKYIDPQTIVLEEGDIVHRHLQDGDWALFNRHPSLHRMSMMGHRIKVFKNNDTMRLNVYVCKPYNADFDGDKIILSPTGSC